MHIKHIYCWVIGVGGLRLIPNFEGEEGLRFFMNLMGGLTFFATFEDRDFYARKMEILCPQPMVLTCP